MSDIPEEPHHHYGALTSSPLHSNQGMHLGMHLGPGTNSLSSGEHVLKILFADFVYLSGKKIEQAMKEPHDSKIADTLQVSHLCHLCHLYYYVGGRRRGFRSAVGLAPVGGSVLSALHPDHSLQVAPGGAGTAPWGGGDRGPDLDPGKTGARGQLPVLSGGHRGETIKHIPECC